MTTPYRITTTAPDRWVLPRPRSGNLPHHIHGPLLGKDDPLPRSIGEIHAAALGRG